MSKDERIFLVKNFHCCGKNRQGNADIEALRLKFSLRFHKPAPRAYNITLLMKKFDSTGSVLNQNKGHSGRRVTTRTADNKQRVITAFKHNPSTSIRKVACQMQMHRSSVHRILQDNDFFPYKTQVYFKLTNADFQSRLQFCHRFLQMHATDNSIINNLWMSDEAHFYLEGTVNKQNMRMWGTEMPQTNFRVKPLHPVYVTAWVAISCHGIIGPYWFEDDNANHLSVTAIRYHNMLETFFYPQLLTFTSVDLNKQWMQQDGSTSHTALLPRDWLKEKFPNRLISKYADFPWPARLPDLSVLDFYLWGALKDLVFKTPVNDIDQLKLRITEEIRKITLDVIRKAFNNFLKRLEECISNDGAHVRNILHHRTPIHIR